jgi:ATP-dependent Clp protease ATP-binding subunit ClpA
MLERFTSSARQVAMAAREERQRMHHASVGTEHLLLALLDSRSGAPSVLLHDAGITREHVIAEIERLVDPRYEVLGDGDAAALEAIGIDLDTVRAKVEEVFGPGSFEPPVPPPRRGLLRRRPGGGSFSTRAKKVLELSLREAVALHHNFIGSEHILLGLLRENGGLAARILADAGVDFDRLRQQTVEALKKAA